MRGAAKVDQPTVVRGRHAARDRGQVGVDGAVAADRAAGVGGEHRRGPVKVKNKEQGSGRGQTRLHATTARQLCVSIFCDFRLTKKLFLCSLI